MRSEESCGGAPLFVEGKLFRSRSKQQPATEEKATNDTTTKSSMARECCCSVL
jgi:hypothetical protein